MISRAAEFISWSLPSSSAASIPPSIVSIIPWIERFRLTMAVNACSSARVRAATSSGSRAFSMISSISFGSSSSRRASSRMRSASLWSGAVITHAVASRASAVITATMAPSRSAQPASARTFRNGSMAMRKYPFRTAMWAVTRWGNASNPIGITRGVARSVVSVRS